MHLDESTLKKVSTLARITIKPEEVLEYTQALSNILNWIQQLDAVNTAAIGLTATQQILPAPLREDVIIENHKREQILSNAPERGADIFFSVPKVIE